MEPTVCQFFIQGRCRFGLNCRFEHSYVGANYNKNKHVTASTQQLNNILREIAEDVVATEKGGQWPLSCYSPIRGGVNVAGWEDISPEEVRWKMYQANAAGTLNQCINEIKQLYNNAEQRRTVLKSPTVERVNLIVNVLKGKKEPSDSSNPFASTSNFSNNNSNTNNNNSNIFGSSTTFGNSSANIFGGATPTGSHGSIFGNSSQPSITQGNILGGNSSNFPTQNIFGNSSNNLSQNVFSNSQPNQNPFSNLSTVPSNNIFASTNQNIFSSGQTGMQGNSQNSILPSGSSGIFSNQDSSTPGFGSSGGVFQSSKNENQTNIFGGSSQNENIFKNQNSFGNSGDIFNSHQKSGNIFGNQNLGNNSVTSQTANLQPMDTSVFSKVEDLTEEELKSFAAPTFTFGKIPLKPPPQDYPK